MEKIGFKKTVGVSILLGLGLTACVEEDIPKLDSEKINQNEEDQNDRDVEIRQEYTISGKRITYYQSPNLQVYNSELAYCDGFDLKEVTTRVGEGTSSIERSENHKACADGRLDPSDFPILDKN